MPFKVAKMNLRHHNDSLEDKISMVPLNPNKGNVWNPCQVQGVVAATTTIYLGSGAKFSSKIMFPYKMTSIPTYLAPF